MYDILLWMAALMTPAQNLSHLPPYAGYIGEKYVLDSEKWQLWDTGKMVSSFELLDDPYDGPAEWFVAKLPSGTWIQVESIKRKKSYLLMTTAELALMPERTSWDYYAIVSLGHPTQSKKRVCATISFRELENLPTVTDWLSPGIGWR